MSDINKIVSQKRDYLQTQMVKRTGYHVVLQLYIYHFKVNYSNVRYFQSCFLKSIVSFVMVSIMVLCLRRNLEFIISNKNNSIWRKLPNKISLRCTLLIKA